jgi:hypothetical protein
VKPRLTDPDHQQVEDCLASLEQEDQRQAETLRRYLQRERNPYVKIPNTWLLTAAVICILVAAGLAYAIGWFK